MALRSEGCTLEEHSRRRCYAAGGFPLQLTSVRLDSSEGVWITLHPICSSLAGGAPRSSAPSSTVKSRASRLQLLASALAPMP